MLYPFFDPSIPFSSFNFFTVFRFSTCFGSSSPGLIKSLSKCKIQRVPFLESQMQALVVILSSIYRAC